MPAPITSRPLTEPERLELQTLLAAAPTPARRRALTASNAFVMWGVMMLSVMAVWLVTASLVKALSGQAIGWDSAWRVPVTLGGGVVCAVLAVAHSLRWIRGVDDPAPALQADLAAGVAEELQFDFTEALRFQEPEHGGVVWFLRTPDDQAYVLYDHESQERGVRGEDPLGSSFVPNTRRVVVRAPRSLAVLSARFEGGALPWPPAAPLKAPPSDWPDHEALSAVPWPDVAGRFGGS